MQELIEDFVEEIFSPEFISNVKKAFSLFEAFEHQNAYMKLMEIVQSDSVTELHSRADSFSVALSNELNFIINEHLIFLNDQATISDQIKIADALYRVQHLEDYSIITAIIEQEDDALDKMSLILEELVTEHDQSYFLMILERVDERVIDLLKTYIDKKQSFQETVPVDKQNENRIQIFNKLLGNTNVGYTLLEAGMIPNLKFSAYMPYVDEHIVIENDYEQTAINILSVMYLSNMKDSDFITMFRAISEELFKDSQMVGKVEVEILKLLARLSDARKIDNEKA